VAAVAASQEPSGSNPGSIQLPPYWEDMPLLWFKQAEGLMDMRNITSPAHRLVMLQCALTKAQLQLVGHILVADLPPATAYDRIKEELTALHQKSEWARLGDLFNRPALGGQRPIEMLTAMEQLQPADPAMYLRYLFFSRLPEWMQLQLAEDRGTTRELARRAEELWLRAPPAATVAAAPQEVVAAASQPTPHRKPWPKKKGGDRKRKRSGDGGSGNGGGGNIAKRARSLGICEKHYLFGREARRCEQPCSWAGN